MMHQCDESLFPSYVFDKEICFMPCHSGSHLCGHWTLIILNVFKKEFHFFDPAMKVKQQSMASEKAFELFSIFLKKFKALGKPSEFTIIHHTYKKQTDSFNCGIYVLYFVEVFMNGVQLSYKELDPKLYRLKMKTYVLQSSDDMKHICRKCFKHDDGQCVQCCSCYTWYHIKCLKLDYKTVSDTGISFRCPTCV